MLIWFTGYSDDLFHVMSHDFGDEFNVYDKKGISAYVDLIRRGERTRVYAIYDVCWSFSVSYAEEGEKLVPIEQVAFYPEHPYCLGLCIEVPDDTRVEVFDQNKRVKAVYNVIQQHSASN